MPKPSPKTARKKPGPKSSGVRENRNISGLATVLAKFDAYCAETGDSLSSFLINAGLEKLARVRGQQP